MNSIRPSLVGLHPQTSKAAHTILNQTLTAGESLLSRTVLSAEQLSLAPGGATSAGQQPGQDWHELLLSEKQRMKKKELENKKMI